MGRFRARRVMAMMLVCMTGGPLLAGCAAPADPAPTPNTSAVTVPLQVEKAQGARRAAVTVAIGGASPSLLFDTGSVGISVLDSALPDDIAELTGEPFTEAFAGGVVLEGTIVAVDLEIAGVPSAAPVLVRVIDAVSCDGAVPQCAAASGMAAFAKSIGADGIFGAGMWADGDVFSPLLQLEGVTPGAVDVHWNGTSGAVTLRPEASGEPLGTLAMPPATAPSLPNGVPSWDNRRVPVCWRIDGAESTCLTTVFDSGAAAMSFPIGVPGGPTSDVRKLANGIEVSASADTGSAPFWTFETGRRLGLNLVTVMPGSTSANTGIQIFNDFTVGFGVQDGSIRLYRPE